MSDLATLTQYRAEYERIRDHARAHLAIAPKRQRLRLLRSYHLACEQITVLNTRIAITIYHRNPLLTDSR